MAVNRVGLCVVCKINKRRWANGCCDKCNALVEAEKSHEQLGVPKEPKAVTQLRENAKIYNRLIRKGKTQKEIAEQWGWTQSQVASMVYRAKIVLGMPMMNATTGKLSGINKYTLKKDTRLRRNEHGGGKCGIRSCKCDLCVERRRLTRQQYAQEYKPRRQVLAAENKKQKKKEEHKEQKET